MFFSALCLLLVLTASAQTPPFLQARGDAFTESNTRFFCFQLGLPIQQGSSEQGTNAFIGCDHLDEYRFRIWAFNEFEGKKIDYVFKIFKVSFAHLNSLPTDGNGNLIYANGSDFPSGFDHAERISVYNGGSVNNVSDSPINLSSDWDPNTNNLVMTVDPGFAYFAELAYRKSISFNWKYDYSASINFIPGAPSTVDADLLNVVSTTSLPSLYGQTPVDELSACGDFMIDASASSCEDGYSYTIQAFDLVNWQADLNKPTFASGPIPGDAGMIDLDDNYNFENGVVYHVSVAVGPTWSVENFFFRLKDASIGMSLPYESLRTIYIPQKGGLTAIHQVRQICDNITFLNLNTAGTADECGYSVLINEVDGSYAPITSTAVSSSGSNAPALINLSSLYTAGFQNNKLYSVTYKVTEPEETRILYFEFVPCLGSRRLATDQNADEMNIAQQLNAFPNPAVDGHFNLTIPEGEFNVAVYNGLGQQVFVRAGNNATQIAIDLSQQPKGVYFLRYTQDDQNASLKLVKP